MTELKKFFVMLLVFGFIAISTLAAQADRALNGTWIRVSGDIEHESRFNNGNYEILRDGIPLWRGTYTTGNGEITFNPTHFHGRVLEVLGILEALGISEGLESRWYPRNEFIVVARPILQGAGAPAGWINYQITRMISPTTERYSVAADSLITIGASGLPLIFTRR